MNCARHVNLMNEYERLIGVMLERRKSPDYTEEEEDAYLEELNELWYQMSEEETEAIEQRLKERND